MPAEGADYVLRLFIANSNVPLWLSCISMTAEENTEQHNAPAFATSSVNQAAGRRSNTEFDEAAGAVPFRPTTWVGAGYLNGAAEAVFTSGILWCQAPIGYAISLILGGRFFAAKMRITDALTMLDPFQHHYGRWIGVMLCLPALCGEVFWTASILSALGYTMQTTISLNSATSIVVSSAVILMYTVLGGHYSVVYTDVLQFSTILVGLGICVPFILKNDNVGKIGAPYNDWIGRIEMQDVSQVVDKFLMTVFGGIPWQVSL
ncbi:high-affinity choline transporter 1-like [Haemaphysalis longicornis]